MATYVCVKLHPPFESAGGPCPYCEIETLRAALAKAEAERDKWKERNRFAINVTAANLKTDRDKFLAERDVEYAARIKAEAERDAANERALDYAEVASTRLGLLEQAEAERDEAQRENAEMRAALIRLADAHDMASRDGTFVLRGGLAAAVSAADELGRRLRATRDGGGE